MKVSLLSCKKPECCNCIYVCIFYAYSRCHAWRELVPAANSGYEFINNKKVTYPGGKHRTMGGKSLSLTINDKLAWSWLNVDPVSLKFKTNFRPLDVDFSYFVFYTFLLDYVC